MVNLPLYQEYLLRKGYARPVFHYEKSSVLYFKNTNDQNITWYKFTLTYEKEGNFFCYCCKLGWWIKVDNVIFTDSTNSQHYVDIAEEIVCEYLRHIKKKSKDLAPIQDMAAWELFLFLNDDSLSKQIPVSWHVLIAKTLSDECPLPIRRATKNFLLKRMQGTKEFNHLYAAWQKDFEQHANESSQWLIDLINAQNT